ncbi:MAG: hypothetical protein NVV82_08125 [Sporocytophaga sp.]|jgi:hypothetical protein|nr:hypothetical protein [Sporocytophaga sp.]
MQNLQYKIPALYNFLKQDIKAKALKLAYGLIEEGFEKDLCFEVALVKANLTMADNNKIQKYSIHLIPHMSGWGVCDVDAKLLFVEESKSLALARARKLAKSAKIKMFIHNVDKTLDCESFEVNFPVYTKPPVRNEYAERWKMRVKTEK